MWGLKLTEFTVITTITKLPLNFRQLHMPGVGEAYILLKTKKCVLYSRNQFGVRTNICSLGQIGEEFALAYGPTKLNEN